MYSDGTWAKEWFKDTKRWEERLFKTIENTIKNNEKEYAIKSVDDRVLEHFMTEVADRIAKYSRTRNEL